MAEPVYRPMLASAGPVPQGPGWAFEFAWEGARTVADVDRDGVRLIGTQGAGLMPHFPELDALREVARRRRVVLDGTVVALDAFGRPNPVRLQRRMAVQQPSAAMLRRLPVAYYVFDLLRLGNRSTLDLPYEQRRALLEELRLPGGPVALSPSFTDTDGRAVLDTAAQYGLHGVVAKRVRSQYQPGRRSRSWVETALRRTQEVVVGGWVPRDDGDLGAALVGVPTERGLHYVGRIGTGFSDAARRELAARLGRLEREVSPFTGGVFGARWVSPELLGEVSYRRWTPQGRLDRPVWLRERPGRHPAAVQVPVVLSTPGAADDDQGIDELDGALRRARAEVDALRAQIPTPHFLNNVLNMIGSYIRIDQPLARELLGEFAEFARYALRTGVERTTVREELDNVERYLALQRARFGDRLRVDLHVAPTVLAVELPFLAVQLAVDNAVQHRIEPKPEGGTLTIAAVERGGDCVVTVADDGTDADPGAPLRSLDQRLRSIYGEHRGLLVESRPGGTRISIRVPKQP